jgi:hypothetical protein
VFFWWFTQFEYTINQVGLCFVFAFAFRFVPSFCAPYPNRETQGISPTLLYPVPTREESWLLSKIIHSVRDYYPLWQVCLLIRSFVLLFKFI